jgi:putative ABC transport system ATP-binding protein
VKVVVARDLSKTYQNGAVAVPAVREVSFAIGGGSLAAFVGPSGSGKSTLLNMVGCLDHPSAGSLAVLGTDVASLERRAAADFRGANLGFIFQDFNLIPVLYRIIALMKKMRDESGTTYGSDHCPATCIGDAS